MPSLNLSNVTGVSSAVVHAAVWGWSGAELHSCSCHLVRHPEAAQSRQASRKIRCVLLQGSAWLSYGWASGHQLIQ